MGSHLPDSTQACRPLGHKIGVWLICFLALGVVLFALPARGKPIGQIPSLEELTEYERGLVQINRESPGANLVDKFGSDPFKIRYLPDLKKYLILLRNRSEVLLADHSLTLIDRKPRPGPFLLLLAIFSNPHRAAIRILASI